MGHMLLYLEAEGCSDGDQHKTTMQQEYMLIENINRCVLTGDTVFIGGCGKFFEGNAAGMLHAMDVTMGLPDDTKILCGHEYTMSNFKFCLKADPGNPKIKEFAAKYEAILADDKYTVPSILSDEKEYNVFMRCRNPGF